MSLHVLNPPEYEKEKVVLVFSLAVCVSVWLDGCAEREGISSVLAQIFLLFGIILCNYNLSEDMPEINIQTIQYNCLHWFLVLSEMLKFFSSMIF
jgi:hypothetical protein